MKVDNEILAVLSRAEVSGSSLPLIEALPDGAFRELGERL